MAEFCTQCGAALNEKTGKCPNCNSVALNEPKKLKPKKTLKIIIASVLALAILVVGTIGGIHFFKDRETEIKQEFDAEKVFENYSDVKFEIKCVEERYIENDYVNPDSLSDLLKDFEVLAKKLKSNKIVKNYELQTTSVVFKLNSGIIYVHTIPLDGVMSGDDIGNILTVEPYAKSSEFVGNYLIGGKSPDKMVTEIENKLPNDYTFLNENNLDCFELDFVEKLINKKVILWYGHGVYSSEFGSMLGTGIPITDQYTLLSYQFELLNNELYLGDNCFGVTPIYFANKLPSNSLQGSMVFLGACQSAMDNRLAEVFINKGASLVVGNSESIRIRYLLYMMNDFISALTYQYDDGSYWTAEDALEYAKKQNGDRDSDFWSYGAEVKLIYPKGQSNYRLKDLQNFSQPEPQPNAPQETKPNNKALSPKSAVDIYMSNKDVWMENPEYMPMNGYGYCLLDLDFDGVLELIKCVNDGSLRISYNTYYKINQKTNKVEQIESNDDYDGDGGYDLMYLTDYPLLYKNNSDGSMFYYCSSFARITTGEYISTFGKMHIKDNKVMSEKMFSEYICEAGIYDNNEEISEFNYYKNGKSVDISKSEYEKKKQEFEKENKNLNLKWKAVRGADFDKADSATQKQMLLDAYNSFSYDGFSFKNVETYDIDIPTKSQIPIDAFEYDGHYYKVYDNKISWIEAEEFCVQLGGHLVTITSEEENKFVVEVIKNSSLSGACIGLTDRVEENKFQWVTEEGLAYTKWRSGEPNNENNEDYVIMRTSDGTWNDGHLESENWPFVCEWE